MSIFIKKFKKLKTIYKVLFFILSFIFLLSIIFISYNLLLLKRIETILRIVFLVFIYIGFIIYLLISLLLLYSKKNKRYIGNSVFIFLVSILFFIVSFYINKTYNIVDNMTKDTLVYSSSLVIMKDNEFKNNDKTHIGMINDEEDIEGYILADKLIDKKKLDKITIDYYNSYLEMLADMYNGEINGCFLSSDYSITFSSYENYTEIKNDTKIIYSYKEKRKNKDLKLTSNKSLTEPFTVLILGVDSEAEGLTAKTAFNGDTMMLVTFNPTTLDATVFSVPRDTYVPIACNNNTSNKINSSAVGGASCVIKTLQNLTDINIDYYVKINFKGVVDLVNSLDGVNVDVPVDFCEQDSNRQFGDSEICLKKGEQKLNGEQALALSRHRHSLPLGDFQRVQHQQLVVEAIAKKAKTIRSVNKFYDVLDAISKNIETNISTEQMMNLYNVGKKMLVKNDANINIQKTYLTGYDLTMYIPGLGNVYTFQYYKESLNEIVKAMKVNLELDKPILTKTFNFSVNYAYEPAIIGKQYYTVQRNEAFPNFVNSSFTYLQSWASSRNIEVIPNYITEGMSGYDEGKNNGYIISQSVIKGTLVSTVKSITVNVIKKENETNVTNTEVTPVINDSLVHEDDNNNVVKEEEKSKEEEETEITTKVIDSNKTEVTTQIVPETTTVVTTPATTTNAEIEDN